MKKVLLLLLAILVSKELFSQCNSLYVVTSSSSVCSPVSNWTGITVGLPTGAYYGSATIDGYGTFDYNGLTTATAQNLNLVTSGSITLPAISWSGIGTATVTVYIYDSNSTVLGCGQVSISLHGTQNLTLTFSVSWYGVAQCQRLWATTGFDTYQWYKNGGIVEGKTGPNFNNCDVQQYDCFCNTYTVVASGACLVTQSYSAIAR